MTKAELVDHVAATVQLSKAQTDAVLTQCLQAIIAAVQAGEVDLRGFGRFHVRHRQPRTGRNPRTGETLQIPAKAVPTLRRGKPFRTGCNPAPRRRDARRAPPDHAEDPRGVRHGGGHRPGEHLCVPLRHT